MRSRDFSLRRQASAVATLPGYGAVIDGVITLPNAAAAKPAAPGYDSRTLRLAGAGEAAGSAGGASSPAAAPATHNTNANICRIRSPRAVERHKQAKADDADEYSQ